MASELDRTERSTSAFEMLECGITTVQHLHGFADRAIARVQAVAEQVLKPTRTSACASLSYAVRTRAGVYDPTKRS